MCYFLSTFGFRRSKNSKKEQLWENWILHSNVVSGNINFLIVFVGIFKQLSVYFTLEILKRMFLYLHTESKINFRRTGTANGTFAASDHEYSTDHNIFIAPAQIKF